MFAESPLSHARSYSVQAPSNTNICPITPPNSERTRTLAIGNGRQTFPAPSLLLLLLYFFLLRPRNGSKPKTNGRLADPSERLESRTRAGVERLCPLRTPHPLAGMDCRLTPGRSLDLTNTTRSRRLPSRYGLLYTRVAPTGGGFYGISHGCQKGQENDITCSKLEGYIILIRYAMGYRAWILLKKNFELVW